MSKLSEIIFKPLITKEVESFGHKVTLRSLTSKDNMELELDAKIGDDFKTKELTMLAYKILSRSLVNVDGVAPDSPAEVVGFLEQQAPEVVFDLLSKYQELVGITKEEIKN